MFFRLDSNKSWRSAVWIPAARHSIVLCLPLDVAAQPGIGRKFFVRSSPVPNGMRVLKVVQSYFPFQDRGGPVVKVRALARGLAQRGHQVTVLTADLGLQKLNGSAMSFQPCPWGWRAEEDGVESIYLSTL